MYWEEVIDELRRLAFEYRDGVPMHLIPEPAQPDFNKFIFGQTVFKNEKGEFCVMHHDYVNWLKKIWFKGFEIPMNVRAKFVEKYK